MTFYGCTNSTLELDPLHPDACNAWVGLNDLRCLDQEVLFTFTPEAGGLDIALVISLATGFTILFLCVCAFAGFQVYKGSKNSMSILEMYEEQQRQRENAAGTAM